MERTLERPALTVHQFLESPARIDENTRLLPESPTGERSRSDLKSCRQALWEEEASARGFGEGGNIEAATESCGSNNDIEKNNSILKGFFVILLLGEWIATSLSWTSTSSLICV